MEDILTYLSEQITSFDRSILRALYHSLSRGTAGHILDNIMPFFTMLGDYGIVWIVLSIVFMIPKKTRRTGFGMALSLVLCLIFGNGIIKNLVARPRPFDLPGCTLSRDRLLIPAPTDYSFPSGHTMSSVAAATALFKDHSVLGFLAFVLALAIAFSRLYLQVHYPSDVLGGLIIGFLMGLWGCNIVKVVADRFTKNKHNKKKEESVPVPVDTEE